LFGSISIPIVYPVRRGKGSDLDQPVLEFPTLREKHPVDPRKLAAHDPSKIVPPFLHNKMLLRRILI
jgi:hypothetical protein